MQLCLGGCRGLFDESICQLLNLSNQNWLQITQGRALILTLSSSKLPHHVHTWRPSSSSSFVVFVVGVGQGPQGPRHQTFGIQWSLEAQDPAHQGDLAQFLAYCKQLVVQQHQIHYLPTLPVRPGNLLDRAFPPRMHPLLQKLPDLPMEQDLHTRMHPLLQKLLVLQSSSQILENPKTPLLMLTSRWTLTALPPKRCGRLVLTLQKLTLSKCVKSCNLGCELHSEKVNREHMPNHVERWKHVSTLD